METKTPASVVMTAKEKWDRLAGKRNAVLERARDCSALTIPALVPPEGHDDNCVLPTPYQSLGARGVNNIASKLLMSLFPPGTPFLKYQISPKVRKDLAEKETEVDAALAERERVVSAKIETIAARPVLFETFKHIAVAGNVLLNFSKDSMRLYRLDQFAIARKPDGSPTEAVIKECIYATQLAADVAAACAVGEVKADTKVDLYTCIYWGPILVTEHQEINGVEVPNSRSSYALKKSPWLALRWSAVPGQDYGRGIVEEYLGDLRSLEGISEAIVQFAAAAAKVLFIVSPGAVTKFKDIVDAQSGEAVVGNRDEIHTLQIEKFNDFTVSKAVSDELTIRLSNAFLLRGGTIRQAERVTAEEIRATAQELEDVLGGVYTVQAVELQLPLARILTSQMERSQEILRLPEGLVEPVIITGFEALGRNHGVNRLRGWLADFLGLNPNAASTLKWREIGIALGTGHGVENLMKYIKTDEEIAADQQRAMLSDLASKAAGPAAGAATKAAGDAINQ